MTFKRLYKVNDNKLIITLPAEFRDKQVLVTIDDKVSLRDDKMTLMKQAIADPMYLADLKEVNDDFAGINHETL
jgi:hypothetical protein